MRTFPPNFWNQVVDSEYGMLALSVRLRSDTLHHIYNWACATSRRLLAGCVFELFVHRLASENMLKLFVSEHDPPERYKPDEPRHLEVKEVGLRRGNALCTGTASAYETSLTSWRDTADQMYWFPACHDFPNIDSIVKLTATSTKKSNVAYLQVTIAREHDIDADRVKKMNELFFPPDVEAASNTKPLIFIVVCPDLATCRALVLKPSPDVLEVRKTCQVYVGYVSELSLATL